MEQNNVNTVEETVVEESTVSTPPAGFQVIVREFLKDKKTQQAVILNLIIIGEAAIKIMDNYEDYTRTTPEVPWRSMRNMRNRLAHGYFDINLDIVWDTVKNWLPSLLEQEF